MGDYKSLCAAVMICVTVVVSKLHFYVLTLEMLNKSKVNHTCYMSLVLVAKHNTYTQICVVSLMPWLHVK